MGDLGEFGLIERLMKYQGARKGLQVGMGDDTAVLDPGGGRPLILFTADTLVQGVHFLPGIARAYDAGRKAMAVNVSDIAAMGGSPTFATVSLIVPPSTDVRLVEELYRGMADEAKRWDAALVGGDTVSTEGPLALQIALLGEAQRGRAILRSGALVGDLICVTHRLGDAHAGLQTLTREDLQIPPEVRSRVQARHLRPTPRVAAGQELALELATSMIDISDGLSSDLGHICRASGLGAIVYADKVPISADAREVAEAAGDDPLIYALAGGEDFELLFTTNRRGWAQHTLPRSGAPFTVIGEILSARDGVRLQFSDGEQEPLEAAGYRHF